MSINHYGNVGIGATSPAQLLEVSGNAGKSRFRAIFLTSLTTIAGLAPLLLEKSRQAQFLKPMAISISVKTLSLYPVISSNI